MSVSRVSAMAFAAILLIPSGASAHAERKTSTPEPGDRLEAAPNEVKIDFTEPPTGDSVFKVFDGCERDVVESFEILNGEITAKLRLGQPGEWVASWQVVSAVDGHPTKDQMTFTVEGEPDCAEPVATPTSAATDAPEPDDGGSSPFMPILLVSAGIIGLAVIGRLVFK